MIQKDGSGTQRLLDCHPSRGLRHIVFDGKRMDMIIGTNDMK
jgi:N-formylglutamate amidohydrolase